MYSSMRSVGLVRVAKVAVATLVFAVSMTWSCVAPTVARDHPPLAGAAPKALAFTASKTQSVKIYNYSATPLRVGGVVIVDAKDPVSPSFSIASMDMSDKSPAPDQSTGSTLIPVGGW